MTNPPKASPRSHITARIVAGPGPIARFKARRYGLDTLLRRPPALELYYEAGDPHSHLAAQLLPRLLPRLKVPVQVRVVGTPEPVLYPEADKQRAFALEDARRIAPAWGLQFAAEPVLPAAAASLLAARRLLACTDTATFLEREAELAPALFAGRAIESGAQALDATEARAALAANVQRRAALGHYLPGMWQFDGDWFWGIDRLDALAGALRRRDALDGDAPLLDFDPAAARLPTVPIDTPVVEFFYSFRSPYSYLAAEQVAQADWPAPLSIRPVLPMAMRGMKIPRRKGLYIARDVKREADRLGLPFGRIADPLGAGAERCLSLFPLAPDTAAQLAFLLSASRGVWSEGIDVATDAGLRFVWERAGLDWPPAAAKLARGMDLDYAEQNRQALFTAGAWGVPSFRYGDFMTWGRDRIWMLEEVFRRRLNGES